MYNYELKEYVKLRILKLVKFLKDMNVLSKNIIKVSSIEDDFDMLKFKGIVVNLKED